MTQPLPLTAQRADDWYPEREDELPPRPRLRLLSPLTVSLMLVLFAACGFIGGVLVEKGQSSSSPSTVGAGAAGRFAGAGATGASGAAGAGGRFASLFGGGAGSRGTVGTVTNINGDTLYVTTATGNMVAVKLTPLSKVTKSQSVKSGAIHPGDSVVVTGITASNGTVTANTISDSGSSGGGGLASLFGGSGAAGAGAAASGSGGAGGGGGGSLFGGG